MYIPQNIVVTLDVLVLKLAVHTSKYFIPKGLAVYTSKYFIPKGLTYIHLRLRVPLISLGCNVVDFIGRGAKTQFLLLLCVALNNGQWKPLKQWLIFKIINYRSVMRDIQ
jgi:hypothetical protein